MSEEGHLGSIKKDWRGFAFFVRTLIALTLATLFLWLPQVIPYEDSFFLYIAMLMLLLCGIVFLGMGLFRLWCMVAGKEVAERVLAEFQKPITIPLKETKPQEE